MSHSGGLYAAYGSNMDPEQMLERCPHSPAAGTGWLPGWRLTFGGEELGWDGALPMIVPEPDAARCSSRSTRSRPHDMVALDDWEGADTGLYDRIRLRVLDPRRRRARHGSTCSTASRAACPRPG